MCDNLPSDEIFGFEGPEKKLEIDFKHSKHASLSHVEKDEWQRMLDEAKCTIISTMKNDHCTCFVLSESSLFVYPFKVIIKTCGTTTLLKCIPVLLEIAKGLDLEVDFLWFSRKNLNFPEKQLFPHSCFEEETEYLNDHFHGKSYILGPKDRDHWYLYIADLSDKNNGFDKQHAAKTDITMEVLMHDMPVSVTQQFVRSDDFVDAKTTTKTSGIADLLPNSMIDDFAFDPCGYSMNGLLDEAYWTIHITPEQHCSFVSFETNFVFSSAEAYQKLLQKVIDTFRPGRVTTTLFADEAGELEHKTHYAFPEEMDGHAGSHYELLNKTYTEFEGKCGYNLTLCNYVLRPSAEGER